jgi:hypothetical protein
MMTAREHAYVTSQVASGRRAGFRLLDLLEVGFTSEEAVQATAPGLSPTAATAAQKLAAQASLYITACALVLAGLVDDSTLRDSVIPEAPAWREHYRRVS